MNTQEFWSIIDRSQSGADRQRQLDLLSQELRSLSQYEYQSFVEHFCKFTVDLRHRDEIVNAAYLAYEECLSSDILDYFCWWLVSMGPSTLAEIATNPDVITDLIGIHKDPNFEGLVQWCTAAMMS